MSVAELLLKLSGESLLNLVEVREERNWDKDDNRAFTVADFKLRTLSIRLVEIDSGLTDLTGRLDLERS